MGTDRRPSKGAHREKPSCYWTVDTFKAGPWNDLLRCAIGISAQVELQIRPVIGLRNCQN
jgi:hypothetical protein